MSSDPYKGKMRIRACGLLVENEKLLLVQLHSPVTNKLVWLAPGGGVDFGESITDALKREFKEETGLEVSVGNLLHIDEMIQNRFHAIELYFQVEKLDGELELGTDPEHLADAQLLKNIQYFSKKELQGIEVAPHFLKEEFWRLDKNFGIDV